MIHQDQDQDRDVAGPDQSHFLVAQNPKEGSRLPYIIRLPVAGEAPVTLACGDSWPGAKDVFCLKLDDWPDDDEVEVIESVPVQHCWRVGKAVHLVLQRRRRRRSMFVWTQSKGRTLIFWRTQRTMKGARPGLKVPQARGLEASLTVAVDIREQYAWRFRRRDVLCVRRDLPVGDYGIFVEDRLCAVVERKAIADLASAATGGTLSFVLAELSRLPHAALVVEGRLSDLLKIEAPIRSGWLMNVIAALQVTYPKVNWIFAETRDLAEDFAYRWLAAARQAATQGVSAPYATASKRSPNADARTNGALSVAEEAVPYTVHDRRGRIDKALELAKQGCVWTSARYAEHFGVGKATAWKDLSELVAAKALQVEGGKRNRRYVCRVRGDGPNPHNQV